MSDHTAIEWTDATWNPVTGCTKVSQGCKHCYAERDWARLSANPATKYFRRAFADVQCHPDALVLPLRWTKPRRIFVNSMSDLFHPDVPIQFLEDVMTTMEMASHHTFQVLTKRPAQMLDALQRIATPVPPNVWLGVSIEDQATADERLPLLMEVTARVRWVSAEPLLGPMNIARWLQPRQRPNDDGYGGVHVPGWTTDFTTLGWIVVGGESGPHARLMHPAWVRSLRDQCIAARVPFLFKQWGEWLPDERDPEIWHKVGKKAAGRLLDGRTWDEYPA